MLYLYNLNVASYTMDELLLSLCSRKYVPSFVGISNSDANDIVCAISVRTFKARHKV